MGVLRDKNLFSVTECDQFILPSLESDEGTNNEHMIVNK